MWLAGCLAQPVPAQVVINEFLADNEDGLRTQAGAAADWIELANLGPEVADLSGWYLTDRAAEPTKWRIPAGTTIPAHGFLVIFADSTTNAVVAEELHASFSLSRDGEYLGLIEPDGRTVAHEYAPGFPPQLRDTSYGLGTMPEDELVGAATPVRYRVPNAEGTAAWRDGVGSLGFSGSSGGFTVRYYEMRRAIDNVDAAEGMVANRSSWRTDAAYPLVSQHETINFHGTSSPGAFLDDALFPHHAFAGQDKERFVVVAEGVVLVPAPGQWTFAVGSDDGFRLRLAGHEVEFVAEYATGRSFDTTLATFNFPVAGAYDLRLIYYESSGGASVELSAAPGFQEAFSPEVFRLVGDPESGLVHAGAIGALIETDVAAGMRGVNARLDAEWSFTLEATPADTDRFTFWVRAADGFVASLNGAPIAALHAPVGLEWNSPATGIRPVTEAVHWEAFVLPAGVVTAGVNTLAITALNDTAADPEFLIAPRLTRRDGRVTSAYFKTPTPGAANAEAYGAPTPVVTVSEPRGYRREPFTVTLECTDASAEIRYTLDASVPGPASPRYTEPLAISRTTTLRAAVVDPAAVRQNVTTVTWLFLEDILQQGATPPVGWPANRQVNNHTMEYGLRREIVTGDGTRLRQGITNGIASLSLVTDRANLFDAQRGIYVNPGNDGVAWERPVSVELIDPVQGGEAEFQIDAGLRIRGAFSRSSRNPKHAFRLFFRSRYGESRLRFALFGDEGAPDFDKVDLRTSQNYSWAYENSPNDTFVRETFSRDSQRDMRMPYTRSRYYHLYLNGQYWGLYQTQERGDADFAESYLGGDGEDWDCIKTSQPGYTTTASDGTFEAFYALHTLAVTQGFSGANQDNYWRARGLNPDGTRNPAYPVYLDEDNLIVYMLVAYYTGDPDSPVSMWGGFPNNMYGLFNRVAPDGFKWLRHDAEHSLGAHSGYPVTCDTTMAGANFTSRSQFNPATLHLRLCQHPEYRRRFADLVQKHLYGDGALTPVNAQERFRSRMAEIDLAIIAESARWGRGKTRDATWLPACNAVVNTYLTQRREILIGQFRQRGWFPLLDAPTCSEMNTEVVPGQPVRLSGTSTFYYTTDGSDPRLADGTINPAATVVTGANGPTGPRPLVARGARWRYFDGGREPEADGLRTWRDPAFADSAWPEGPAILGFAGSAEVNPVATSTRRYVDGISGPQVTTTYFRHDFTVDAVEGAEQLAVDVLRDDGLVVYLNEVEILRDNMNPGAPTYDTYSAGVVSSPDQNTYLTRTIEVGDLLQAGANTVAVEVHQCNESSSDLYFDLSLTVPGRPASIVADLIVNQDLRVKARAFDGVEWSALSESALTVQRPPMNYASLRVTELMYAPSDPEPGSPYDNNDFAWIELGNTGATALDLEGVRFDAGISHTFAPLLLEPGARLVLVKNREAFATRHTTNDLVVVLWDGGNLARAGETLSLTGPEGETLLSFSYTRQWYPATFGTGSTLVAVDLAAPEAVWSTADNWRPSLVVGGTPGLPEGSELRLLDPRVTAEGLFVMEAIGLADAVELWFSEDCRTWALCNSGAWEMVDGVVTVNLRHASFPVSEQGYFQLRQVDTP